MKMINKIYKILNLNFITKSLPLLLTFLLFISCDRKKNLNGIWEVYTLFNQNKDILKDSFFESIHVPVLEFDYKKVRLRVDMDYYFICDYKMKGDNIIFKNCDKQNFEGIYLIKQEEIYNTKSRSLYYMVLKSENVLLELEKTTIKL
tara:strand:- start:11859 stop:12299 length:441 start_codon:yes stop_codon:yes gene_type:complete